MHTHVQVENESHTDIETNALDALTLRLSDRVCASVYEAGLKVNAEIGDIAVGGWRAS